jgi:hypothetical protein
MLLMLQINGAVYGGLVLLSPFSPHLFPTRRRSLVMALDKEKDQDLIVRSTHSSSFESDGPMFYDPSKESVWTRIGLSLESFKRAPGVTR